MNKLSKFLQQKQHVIDISKLSSNGLDVLVQIVNDDIDHYIYLVDGETFWEEIKFFKNKNADITLGKTNDGVLNAYIKFKDISLISACVSYLKKFYNVAIDDAHISSFPLKFELKKCILNDNKNFK